MAKDQLAFSIKILGADGEISKLAKIEQSLQKAREQRSFLNQAYKNGEVSEKQLAQSTAELNITTKLLNKEKRDITRTIELETQKAQNQDGTYKNLDATLQIMKRDYKALSEEERNSAKGQELLQKIQSTDKTLKEFDSSIGQYQRNVGNYSGALQGLNGVFSVFGVQIDGQLDQLNQIRASVNQVITALTAQKSATEGMVAAQNASNAATTLGSKALRILRIALISTGIGAIVVVIGSLIAALTSTQRGVDAVNSVLRPLKAIFASIIGVIQNQGLAVFDKLRDAINNPKQALKDLGQAIVDNVVNRFKALRVLAGAIGKLLKGEFAAAAKDIANGTLQAATGVENTLDKMQEAGKRQSDFIKKAIEDGKKLDALQKEIERREIDLARSQEERNAKYQELREAANDQTKSDAERIAILAKAQKLQNEIAAAEVGLIDAKITKMKLEHSLNDTSRADELELAKLEGERARAIADSTKKRASLESLKTGIIKRQIQEQRKAQADELKSIEENSKKIIELARAVRDSEVDLMREGRDKEVEILDNKLADQEAALLAQITLEKDLTGLSKTEADQKRQINALLYDQLEQLREKHRSDLIAIDAKYSDEELKEQKALNDAKIKELDQLFTLEQLSIERKVLDGVLTISEGEAEELRIKREYLQKKLALIDKETLEGKIAAEELQNEIQKTFTDQGSIWNRIFDLTDEDRENIKRTALGLSKEISDTIFQINQERRDQEQGKQEQAAERNKNTQIANLDKELKDKRISQEEYAVAKEKIEQNFDVVRQNIERDAFERNKRAAKAQAAINGALAITNIWATTPKADFGISTLALIAASIASTGLQIAAIDAQKYAKGGLVISGERVPASAKNIQTRANGDNVLATVKTGEVVLNQHQQAMLGGAATFRRIGVPGFASGGQIGPIPNDFAFAPALPQSRQVVEVKAELNDKQMGELIQLIGDRIDTKISNLRVSAESVQNVTDDINTVKTASKY